MDYKPGLITASLNKGKTKSGASNPLLTQLFSKPKVAKETTVVKKKTVQPEKQSEKTSGLIKDESKSSDKPLNARATKGVKRKFDDSEKEATKKPKRDLGSNQLSNPSNDFPYVHEALVNEKSAPKGKTSQTKSKKQQKDSKLDDEENDTSTRKRYRRDKTADKRTVFIGNCPLSADKKVMKNLFKEFGSIESLRFRCGPAAKLELPRRVTIIKKEFHEKANSFVCYIVFKEEESAQKAMTMNGHLLNGLHLRVDVASNHKKHDKKRSVFVGNLPFSISEEDLRSHFLDCGTISNVRIVRDRQTSIGKGIAFVQFEDKDGVLLAKKLNGTELQERKLRVMGCTNKEVKNADKIKTSSKSPPPTQKKIMSFAPSNRKSSSKTFTEILQEKKNKRLQKLKKKKQTSKTSDALSSVFGDMSADMKKLKTENPKLKTKKPKSKDKKAKNKNMKKDKKGNKLRKAR